MLKLHRALAVQDDHDGTTLVPLCGAKDGAFGVNAVECSECLAIIYADQEAAPPTKKQRTLY